ncbi:MAG: HNH endonuclease [Terriglobales bacterium]
MRFVMRFYAAITDLNWFTYLSAQKPDEVNFWQPSAHGFKSLEPGEPVLFKLHSPRNYIVGGGFFSHYAALPLTFAWDAFGTKNGAQSLEEMRRRVWKYRAGERVPDDQEIVGCVMLQQPFFFSEPEWIPVSDWPMQTVQGKRYDASEGRGLEIWTEVQYRLRSSAPTLDESVAVAKERFGKPQVILPRLGQGAFRVMVADSYERACAVTGSHILHILDAAHIRPYTQGGTHSPVNGLLLRQDVHTLFDRGYVTVTPDYRLEVSSRIKSEFNNGDDYYALQGREIHLPRIEQYRPSSEALTWHNEQVFRG